MRPLLGPADALRRPGLVLAALVLLTVVAWAFEPRLFTSQDPTVGRPIDKLSPPSTAHLFGTDELGRDVFTRMVYGASLSLRATLLAVVIALVVGSVLGLIAGFSGGWIDDLVMRAVDVLLAIPALLLSLALVTALGFGTTKVALAVGLASVANVARVMRAEVLRVRSSGYVEAARTFGARSGGLLLRHVLPNAYGPVVVLAALDVGTAILSIAALSFLGFGAPPPTPEWGSLVADGRDYLSVAWWLTTLPGLTIAAVVVSANRVARALDGR